MGKCGNCGGPVEKETHRYCKTCIEKDRCGICGCAWYLGSYADFFCMNEESPRYGPGREEKALTCFEEPCRLYQKLERPE